MAKEWYQQLGFKRNPFNIEPKFKQKLFGYDLLLDELFYRIEAGNMIFLDGDIAKTSMLLKIIEKYKGKGKVAYVDCNNVKEEPDIKKLLANGKKAIGMKIRGLPKNMIVLLDNVVQLSRSNAQKIKFYYDSGNILSIIMTGENFHQTNIPASIKHRIGKRVYKLRQPTKDEAVDIILDRINFEDFFKEEHVYKLASYSNDLKELLTNCEAALRLMLNEHSAEVNEKIVNQILRIKEDVVS